MKEEAAVECSTLLCDSWDGFSARPRGDGRGRDKIARVCQSFGALSFYASRKPLKAESIPFGYVRASRK
jgi:hypothetical protein